MLLVSWLPVLSSVEGLVAGCKFVGVSLSPFFSHDGAAFMSTAGSGGVAVVSFFPAAGAGAGAAALGLFVTSAFLESMMSGGGAAN